MLANDPDIGPNPDVAIRNRHRSIRPDFHHQVKATQAQVTVNAYTDNTYTHLITQTDDGQPLTGTMSYTINLQKRSFRAGWTVGQPFRIVVEGCNEPGSDFPGSDIGRKRGRAWRAGCQDAEHHWQWCVRSAIHPQRRTPTADSEMSCRTSERSYSRRLASRGPRAH